MNNLLVQNCNSKFIQNIINLKIDNVNIIGTSINNNLYKLYYTYGITHCLFKAELLNKEMVDFIKEFSNNGVRCFIHHNSPVITTIKEFMNYNVIHLSSSDSTDIIAVPNNLINSKMFFNNYQQRSDSIVCFCEFSILPEFLSDYLYPKTLLPIKLFNNSKISHPQNLGLISESDRAKILQTNKYYLALSEDDQYILEAQHCGAIILQIDQLNNYKNTQYSEPRISIEYIDFVKDIIL